MEKFIGFENVEDIEYNFACKDALKDAEVLFAVYDTGCYEGSAFVLFRKDGKLYEVNGSHCSCYGLEDQWDPEETLVESLEHRLEQGQLGHYYYEGSWRDEFREVLNQFKGTG